MNNIMLAIGRCGTLKSQAPHLYLSQKAYVTINTINGVDVFGALQIKTVYIEQR